MTEGEQHWEVLLDEVRPLGADRLWRAGGEVPMVWSVGGRLPSRELAAVWRAVERVVLCGFPAPFQ